MAQAAIRAETGILDKGPADVMDYPTFHSPLSKWKSVFAEGNATKGGSGDDKKTRAVECKCLCGPRCLPMPAESDSHRRYIFHLGPCWLESVLRWMCDSGGH